MLFLHFKAGCARNVAMNLCIKKKKTKKPTFENKRARAKRKIKSDNLYYFFIVVTIESLHDFILAARHSFRRFIHTYVCCCCRFGCCYFVSVCRFISFNHFELISHIDILWVLFASTAHRFNDFGQSVRDSLTCCCCYYCWCSTFSLSVYYTIGNLYVHTYESMDESVRLCAVCVSAYVYVLSVD